MRMDDERGSDDELDQFTQMEEDLAKDQSWQRCGREHPKVHGQQVKLIEKTKHYYRQQRLMRKERHRSVKALRGGPTKEPKPKAEQNRFKNRQHEIMHTSALGRSSLHTRPGS